MQTNIIDTYIDRYKAASTGAEKRAICSELERAQKEGRLRNTTSDTARPFATVTSFAERFTAAKSNAERSAIAAELESAHAAGRIQAEK